MAMQAKDTGFERLYTVAEFERMPESDGRWELLNGKLVHKPMVKVRHSTVVDNIRIALHTVDPTKKLGVMLAEVNVFIRSDYAPAPDLSFWIASRKPPLDVLTASRPDLAIEVQSPGQSLKSLEAKAREYVKAGVSLVWIIQPATQKVKIYRAGQAEAEIVGLNGTLSGEVVIEGFELPVKALFE